MRTTLLPGVSALLLLASGCDRLGSHDEARVSQAAAAVPLVKRVLNPEQSQQFASRLCSSPATYERLKVGAFRQAARIRGVDSTPFDRLAAFANVRFEEPLVITGDQAPRLIRCSAHMAIDLPPGTAAITGARTLTSDISFVGQPAADGSGLVWQLNAAEPIVYALATMRRVTGEEFLPPPVVPAVFEAAGPAPGAAPIDQPSPSAPPPPVVVASTPATPVPTSAPSPAAIKPSFPMRVAARPVSPTPNLVPKPTANARRAAPRKADQNQRAERKVAERTRADREAAQRKVAGLKIAGLKAAERRRAERKATERHRVNQIVAEHKQAELRAAVRQRAEQQATERAAARKQERALGQPAAVRKASAAPRKPRPTTDPLAPLTPTHPARTSPKPKRPHPPLRPIYGERDPPRWQPPPPDDDYWASPAGQ